MHIMNTLTADSFSHVQLFYLIFITIFVASPFFALGSVHFNILSSWRRDGKMYEKDPSRLDSRNWNETETCVAQEKQRWYH